MILSHLTHTLLLQFMISHLLFKQKISRRKLTKNQKVELYFEVRCSEGQLSEQQQAPTERGAGYSPPGELQLAMPVHATGGRTEQRARQLQYLPQCLIPGDLVLLSCGRRWPLAGSGPSQLAHRLEQPPVSPTALSPCPPGLCHQTFETEPAAARDRLLLLAEGTAQQWTRPIPELTTPA